MALTRPVRSDRRARIQAALAGPLLRTPGSVTTTALAFAIGAALTVVIAFTTWFPAGYRSATLSLGLNTVDGCIALLVAYLSYGRFERERRLRDRLVAHGLALLGLSAIVLPALSELLALGRTGAVATWATVVVRLMGAGLILAGALSNDRVLRRRPPRWLSVGVPVLGVLAVLLIARAIGSALPPAVVVNPTSSVGIGAAVTSHPAFAAVQMLGAAAFLIASLAFARRAVQHVDDLASSMAPALALGTFALVQYVMFPTNYSDWLYLGDLLRTGCYLLLLIGGAAEIRRYWSAQTREAVLDDRRRLAREIHDGVVQEISYIRMETSSLQPGVVPVERIIDACDRALDEARDAVHALALEDDEPLEHLLKRAAHDLSRRYTIEVPLELSADPEADRDQRWALVRIAREAITNAARHGGARIVRVRLMVDEQERRLEVHDDGSGFDPLLMAEASGGYGLISMRERAAALPGRCMIESQPGSGSTVTVTW